MIDETKQLVVFATVASRKSFRGAAAELRLSPSVISGHISALESRMGTALFYRSTRCVSLTSAGEMLLPSATAVLSAAKEGFTVLNDTTRLDAELRVALPAMCAEDAITDAVAQFAHQHSDVRLALSYSDCRRNIIEDGIDMAIRIGPMTDSNLVSQKLGTYRRVLVASPNYLENYPTPAHPNDLAVWHWIAFTPRVTAITLGSPDGASEPLRARNRLNIDNVYAIRSYVKADSGIAVLPLHLVQSDIDAGTLCRVLPEWTIPALDIYAVWPCNITKRAWAVDFH